MNRRIVKLILTLFLLLLLDITKPFGYSLNVEFLFLGIIFVALNARLWLSLTLAILFGYCKDSFSANTASLSLIGFTLTCLIIWPLRVYLLSVVKKPYRKYVKVIVIITAIAAYIAYNSVCVKVVSLPLSVQFFIQTLLLSFVINFLIEKYKLIYPPDLLSALG